MSVCATALLSPRAQIFDVLIRAASELAGWTGQGEGGGEPSGRPSLLGGVGRERPYPSALMQEARGMTQGSVKRRLLRGRSSAGSDPKGHGEGSSGDRAANGTMTVSGATPSRDGSITETRTRRWGYRRGPRERPRRNLFGRFAPQFFYPLAQVKSYFWYRSAFERPRRSVHTEDGSNVQSYVRPG